VHALQTVSRRAQLNNDRKVAERNEFLNIHETVSDEKFHEAQAEVYCKRAVQRKRTHAPRVHTDILAAGIQCCLPSAQSWSTLGESESLNQVTRYAGL